ncbi:MAG: alanine--tRNA ligase [Thermodesulfobacterium geofontis]|uniref:Alanine--tRNA ligase n=1 Tax=Thermodesulfobacterium geofontis TaxID=1295609 RepID=A0A2N7PMG5_9BACT|nr:MAG: alanine--tRNA ligase [Thermodesulfobacterium geofontis]
MKGRQIRKLFLDYFVERGHELVPSSSLIPADDPTLLFTNAGMVQFKKVFLGEEIRPYKRAVSCQKCVRAGGKHNDLENVGYTARHHTFFEMLGNFSFGDYFKNEAIAYAWDFINKVLNLPKEKLYVTVYEKDDEAVELWKKIAGFSEEKIVKLGEKDNFWAMGDTGPCGPCSEIVYDLGENFGCKRPDCAPGCDCDRFLEVWNLVFMQYEKDEKGNLKPLPKGCIDTGMGLERITAVIQGVSSNYETDLFSGIISKISEITGRAFKENRDTEIAFRVIADHIRASTFILAEGIMPSNEGRGYVLRRIIRRAERFGKLLGLKEAFLYKLVDPVIEEFGDIYPEIVKNEELIKKVLKIEEEKFLETLNLGLEILEKEIEKLQREGKNFIPGEVLFKLYDTYGFPYDLVRDQVLPLGFSLDLTTFENLREKAREESKKTWKGALERVPEFIKNLVKEGTQILFVGYETLETKAKVLEIKKEDNFHYLITNLTPFYPEGGGQVYDTGLIIGSKGNAEVLETYKVGEVIYHKIKILEGTIEKDEEVLMKVNRERRFHIERHHTATHLLHAALRKILGSHVKQAGSLVEEERLRFDFTHFQALTPRELKMVEELINKWVLENHPVETLWVKRESAEKMGAIAIFEEKYGEIVRVVKINEVSMELCGGTHVKRTGDIGLVKLISESSVASGIRRIEAVAGLKAYEWVSTLEKRIENIAETLKTSPKDIEKKIRSLLKEIETLEREIKRLKSVDLKKVLEEKLKEVMEVNGVKILVASFSAKDMAELREIGDYYKNKLGSGIIFLIGERENPLAVCMVTKDLAERYPANKIFQKLEKSLGLKGGGKPELSQGSFKEKVSVEKIKDLLQKEICNL